MSRDNETPIDDFVRRAVGVDEEDVASVWSASEAKQALLQEITTMNPQPTETATAKKTRLPRRRLVPVVVAAVLALSAVGVGANTLFSQTSFDDDELVAGRNINSVIDELGADVPLPPGGSFDALQEVGASGGSQSRAGIAGMLSFHAACQWYAHWYDADTSGQEDVASSAVDVLRDLPTWRPVADTGGETGPFLRDLADDAAEGDREAVRNFLNANCGPDSGWHG